MARDERFSIIISCDRCGAKDAIESERHYEDACQRVTMRKFLVRTVSSEGRSWEVCRECSMAFCRFMEGNNPNAERPPECVP